MNQDSRKEIPRLPLDGNLDLTYRCNNACRHCWLWLPANSPQQKEELSFEEIQRIVDEAREMGCQSWAISGGEPMLRNDFSEIFDYVTRKSLTYKLNTNGTLITPEIAQLMRRKGTKMVALYGATAEVHDRVTRNDGSFEAAMRGFTYLKEAGAGFAVQIVPMQANYHQYEEMVDLARSLSPYYRVGAPWLWLSACQSSVRNREIKRQRLDPAAVIQLDEPYPFEALNAPYRHEDPSGTPTGCSAQVDDRLFASCIPSRRNFHIDPFGQLAFCYYIKDPSLRFDLRQGTFQLGWEEYIPSLIDFVRGGQEYRENCGSCELRNDCRWCAVYAYLEHGRYSAKVDYLCQVASEAHRFKEEWKLKNIRYYKIAGISIQVSADSPFKHNTYIPVYNKFQVDGPGEDTIFIRHVSNMPALSELRLGKQIYRKPPWAIYKQASSWVYLGISADENNDRLRCMAIVNQDHSDVTIYHPSDFSEKLDLHTLTTFPSDQTLLARVLADRQACYLHASGIVIDGKGLLFVGHSDVGKSTMLKMLRGKGTILCDDRIIVRRWPQGFRIHGTWSHGELPDVSPESAPLSAIMFLEQAKGNTLIPILEKKERIYETLSHVIRPLMTADWWNKTVDLAETIAEEVPTYRLQFNKSGQVVDLLMELCGSLS